MDDNVFGGATIVLAGPALAQPFVAVRGVAEEAHTVMTPSASRRAILGIAALALACGDAMSASEARVTVSSLDSDGVALLPSSHPDFGRAFRPGRAKGFDALLPYTTVIRNGTDREIIAFSVVYYCTKNGGKIVTPSINVFNFGNIDFSIGLPPGSAKIVSLSPELARGGASWSPRTEADVKLLTDGYVSYAAIRISLEAVLFADGTAIGPDGANWIHRWKAWLEAEQDVYSKAAQSAPSELRPLLRRLAEPATDRVRAHGGVGATSAWFGTLATHSENYTECVDLLRGVYATDMLTDLDDGLISPIERVRTILVSKQYPKVHRKE